MGKLYGEPQPTAALRLGSMFHHGMVPFLGHNATEALAYYQEVRGKAGRGGAGACSGSHRSLSWRGDFSLHGGGHQVAVFMAAFNGLVNFGGRLGGLADGQCVSMWVVIFVDLSWSCGFNVTVEHSAVLISSRSVSLCSVLDRDRARVCLHRRTNVLTTFRYLYLLL